MLAASLILACALPAVGTSLVGDTTDFFGLPSIASIDSAGTLVKVVVGTTSAGGGRFRCELVYTIPTAGQWRLLVSGTGGQFSTSIGSYTLSFKITTPPKRRAAKRAR